MMSIQVWLELVNFAMPVRAPDARGSLCFFSTTFRSRIHLPTLKNTYFSRLKWWVIMP